MGGVLGVEWRRWTHFDLQEAYRARLEHDWELSSHLQWAAYQFSGFAKQRKQPRDFNPLRKAAPWTKQAARTEAKRAGGTRKVKASQVKVAKR